MIGNHYSVDLLWKEHRPVFPYKRDLPIMCLKSLEKKLKKDPEFHETFENTMKDYISKGHTSKLSLEKHKQTPSHISYNLPDLHACIVCNTMSSFRWKGKVKA